MISIFILSIIGAIVAAVVGTIWYSNATPMGKIHMKYLGFDKLSPEEQKLIENEKKRLSSIPRSKREGGRITKDKVNRLFN